MIPSHDHNAGQTEGSFQLGVQNIKHGTYVSFHNKLLAPHTMYNIFFWFLKFLGSKNKL